MMAAEVASTVIPAIVAAGSAAMVGMQGGEQLLGRGKAVYTVGEALGGPLGMTAGQFFGGGNALQQAQDRYGGGTYGLAGAGINILRSGAGGGFLTLGGQTLAMLDRGAAGAVLNITKGGVGNKLLEALGGGTGYLRQFGDIGANLGTAALNFAPDLPGVGADLLGALTGASGLLRSASGLPSPLLKSFFTYEAASRWGPAILGGQGLIGRMLGLSKVGGLGGLIGKIPGLGGLGGALEGLTGPEIGIPLAAFQLESSLLNRYIPRGASGVASANVAKWQAAVANAGFAGAWTPLAAGLTAAEAGAAAAPPVPAYATPIGPGGRHLPAGRVGVALQDMAAGAPAAIYQQAANQFAQQMGELVNAAPQLVGALKSAGLKGVSFGDALQMAQNALLDIPHSFGKDGKVTKQALQQLTDYAATLGPMLKSPGAFGAAVAGTQIMSSGQMQNLAKVNQAMDAMTQIMVSPALSLGGLAAAHGAAPAGAMAQALKSFTTPAGAAAWSTFASTSSSSPGIILQLQQYMDQMRTGLTLGALTQHQAAQLAGTQIMQFLPMAKQSPAALAMLMQQGAQMGVTGYYDPSKSQAQNFAAAMAGAKSVAASMGQANSLTTQMVEKLSNLPAIAQQLAQGVNTSIQAQREAAMAGDAIKIQQKGLLAKGAISDLVGQLKAAGVQGGAALKASLDAVLQQAGVGKAVRLKIEADTAAAQAAIDAVTKARSVLVKANANTGAAQAAINAIHGKNVTITITTNVNDVYRTINATGQGFITAHPVVARQTGGMVPGSGFGDIVPAMLEPGEAVVPRNLVPLVAPILAAHRVPGFGGMPHGASDHFAAGGIVPLHGPVWIPPTTQGAASGFAVTILEEIAKAIRNSAEAKKVADALVAKLGQEISLAKNISQAAQMGQGYGNTGLLGTFTAPPAATPTGVGAVPPGHRGYNAAAWAAAITQAESTGPPAAAPQTIQQQMASYLKSLTSFTKDIGTLRHDHLNKALIAQLIAEGPVQGDLMAQSILGGKGGVGAINKLWAQIGKQSNALGAQGAMAQFGGFISPNLKSATINTANHVVINVSAKGSGSLDLTPAQIKQLVQIIQEKLLQQARRNNKTGLQSSGKGA